MLDRDRVKGIISRDWGSTYDHSYIACIIEMIFAEETLKA